MVMFGRWTLACLFLVVTTSLSSSPTDASSNATVATTPAMEVDFDLEFEFDLDFDVELDSGSSCASMEACQSCSNTYTCHWCESDQECHAKGSVHGCSWGGSCQKPAPKENSTCASYHTCSDCVLASHLCHWCEHDNACHAMGSRYGCTSGVDCYSNDRCRRPAPEAFHKFVMTEVPTARLFLILFLGGILLGCLSCCHCFSGNIKGAYDDLATISMSASVPPSMIGGTFVGGPSEPFYSTLEAHPEEGEQAEEPVDDEQTVPQPPQPQDEEAGSLPAESTSEENVQDTSNQPLQPIQQQPPQSQREECETNHYLLMDDGGDDAQLEMTPLIHPSSARSFNGIPGMEEPPHMKALHRACSIFYCIAVSFVLLLMFLSIFFYPKPPVYNVCSDAVAWKRIMENLVAMKLDASFEILLSISNANHLGAALDQGKGSFTYDGNPVGTYEIPAQYVDAMAITDMMLIAKVTPDKYQAAQMAQAYYRGKLVLEAEFKAKLRVPALMDLTYDLDMKDIVVNVNELSDRSLCHCPTWDDHTNHSSAAPVLFF